MVDRGDNASFRAWPRQDRALATKEVIRLYRAGHAGARHSRQAHEALNGLIAERGGNPDGEAVIYGNRFAGAGAGKLSLLLPAVEQVYGYSALTHPGQKTGDCVSMAARDVILFLMCLEILSGRPDEETGLIEGTPEVPEVALRHGVLANEPFYRFRGHSSQGMNCDQALRFAMEVGGALARGVYQDPNDDGGAGEGVDLSEYNVQWELPGRRGVPEWIKRIARRNRLRDATRAKTHEQARDFVAQGRPIFICSSLGFSSNRDDNGYSRRSGSWPHSWHVVGYDDRPETKRKYGFPLALAGHRWGQWNRGGRRILGTQIDIPHGYWWLDARLLDRCWMTAVRMFSGWEISLLPDLGATGVV